MLTENHLLLVAASFTMVGLKAFQNQSVIHDWLRSAAWAGSLSGPRRHRQGEQT